jgi:iron complex outermembrane receptor protein
MATGFGDGGWLDLTLFHRFHDFSQRGGADSRMFNRDGTLLSSLSPQQAALYANALGAPNSNRIVGDARSHLTNVFYDTGYDFGGIEAYGFGSFSRRDASAYENYRVPDRVRRSPVLGVRGDLTTPGEMLLYPQGFNPREGIRETDYSATGGLRGDLSGWHWDLSSTYGLDKNRISTLDSANASLYVNTGFTPTDFYSGMFKASEWTNNLDISHEIELGLAKPLNLAFGGEYRENMYEIGAGDEASRYLEGGQSFPGFQATDAGKFKRHNVAAYVDVAVNPIENLKLDGAVRYEDYSDFGTKWTQKLTARYDFSPAFALRGTVSTGFRAPSLLEGFYSATNVGPTSAYVQLPPNSPAAQLLGFDPLKPEKSTNFSAGLVLRPIPRLSITVDAYQVKVRDRIIGSGQLTGTNGGVLVSQAVLDAIAAQGTVLDPTVIATGDTGVSIFANGVDTRTRGIDITASYPMDFAGGRISWTASANYNKTRITKLILPQALYTLDARSLLESGSPRFKIIGGALFTLDKLSVNLRETVYGKSEAFFTDGAEFTLNTVKTAALTDLEVGYDIAEPITVSIGANNLFNKKTPTVRNNSTGGISDGGVVYDAPITFSPYGINGGYYYARVNFKF